MSRFDSHSTRAKVVTSTVAQLASQAFVSCCAVIALKIMTNTLGITSYGTYATAIAFVSIFSLLTDLGINSITAREIAKYPSKANDIITHNMGLRMALCLIMVPTIIGLSFIFYSHAQMQLRLSIALVTIYLFFDSARSVMLAYFTAKVRNDISALVIGAQQLVFLLLCITVAIASSSVYGFIISYILCNATGAVIAFYFTRKSIVVRPRVNIRQWRGIVAMSLSLGVIEIINVVYLKADSVMLSILKTPSEVGIYGVAYAIVLGLMTLPSFIMTALMPSMATSKTTEELGSIVRKAFTYMVVFACLLPVGGFVVRKDLVLAISGTDFESAATPFAVLCLASAFTYLNSVFGFASVSVNKHHRLVFVSIGALGLNVVLNLILIPRYSIDGAAWATAISESLALLLVYLVFANRTGVRVPLLRFTYKPVLAALATLGVCTWLRLLWDTGSPLLNTLIAGASVVCVYGALLVMFRALPGEVTEWSGKVIAKIRHG